MERLKFNSQRMPERVCPWCDYHVDAAVATEGTRAPSPGDFMLCLKCGEWGIETERKTIRKPTMEELIDIGEDETCQHVRDAWVKTCGPGTPRYMKLRAS